MPYIGQRPSKGDENNFKILDDISSYTLTFDGSDSSVVSAANDTITSLTHRFVQGQRVTYNKGGGTVITGLSDGVYYIIKHDHNTIKLATSASNATNGIAVNITGVGAGSSHTLNVAFDGVNTKFKATHTNGQKAKITRSAQLVISINGVIQQPHDSATPSTGFGFDLDGTIVFSQAPVAGDVYWAHVLTNNNVTFDISDNHIDRFTGNASTTAFNLSKSPPDNRNVLVTIDGVVQYPNDPDGTVRAYNVVENVLTFTSAPAAGAEIQVRHIGFAGATSGGGGVTNFYGRTGSVVLKNTDNIVANNAEFAGNLTVQGTMTTLDTKLTEVDQLEVAANNTTVGVAITQSGSGDILNLYDGSTERFSVADGGVTSLKATGDYQGLLINGNICPTVRFAKNNNTTPEWKAGLSGNNSDNFSISLGGTGNDRLILTSTSATINGSYVNVGNLMVDSKVYHSGDSNNFREFGNDIQWFYTNGSERFKIHNSGVNITGVATVTGSSTSTLVIKSTVNNGTPKLLLQDAFSLDNYVKVENADNLVIAADDGNIGTDSYIKFKTDNVERVRIASDGKLHVGGFIAKNTGGFASVISTGGASNNGGFQAHYKAGAYGGGSMTTVNAAGGGLDFWTYTGNVGSELYSRRLRITSNGNLLIGKTADSGKPLEVYQAGDAAIRIQNNASGTGSNDGILLEIGNTSKDALIWNYESANMRFGTAGTERLRITSSGNVGIGTQIPAAKFVVSNDGANGFEFNPNFNSNNSIIASYNRSGGGSYSQLTLSASQHIFAQGGIEYGRFDASGRLGIGTDTAPHKLSVKGTISMISGASATQIVNISQSGSNNGYIAVNDSSGTTRARLDSSGSSYVRGGNFGVGIVSPTRSFHVKGMASGNSTNRMAIFESTGTAGSFIAFQDANTTDDSKCRIGSVGGNIIGIRGDAHRFQDGGGNNKLTIGDTGIFTFYSSAAAWNTLQRATATHYIGLRIQETDGTQRMQFGVAGGANQIVTGAAQHDVVLKAYDANLILATNATERFRIDSSGRVLINTTSNANAHTQADDLVVGNTSHPHDTGVTIVSNPSYSGWLTFSDGTSASDQRKAGLVYQHSSDTLYLRNNGNQNRLIITSDGYVGINESSPASQFVVTQDGLDDNIYNFSTVYRSGNNASGYTASGIRITSKADNSNGEDHTAYIQFDNRTASQNGAHGVAAYITLTTPDAQGTYGTGEYNFYCRNGAPYSFPNDPAVPSNFWMSSLFKIKSTGELFGYGNLRIDTGTSADGIVGRAYGTAYFGLKHADQSSDEYMIISNDYHTYISCTSGHSIYLRPSANSSAHETVFSHDNTTFKSNVVLDNHALRRNQHHWGHMEGGYNNIAASTSKTSPIYTIGSAYNPNEETLGNMYGVGYTHTNASFINSNVVGSWGLYLASDGDARIFLGASDGRIFADQAYGRTSWHKGHLEGGHTNIGASQTKTNPIFTIGSSYNPNEETLSNMYGVGYSNGDNASFLPAGGWGMYVASDGDARIFLDAQHGYLKFNGGSGAVHFTNGSWSGEHSTGKIQTHGNNMYLQTAGGSWQFRKTNGTAAANIASNGTYTASDLTFKKDVVTISNAVDTIKKLTGRSFTWKEDDTKSFGVIAQEVETVLPELVSVTDEPEGSKVEPSKMVNYPAFAGHFIEAIKELSAKIETLEQENTALKARVTTLEG